tara:strand:- start:235 stop:468 length:234 start_codon:yes stop_codon:yes gene_type:complete
MGKLLDSRQAALFLGITVDQLRRRVKSKQIIPVFRSRNTLIFEELKLAKYLEERNKIWNQKKSGGPESSGINENKIK